MALTPAKERFAEDVARRTGLQLPTVRAWVAIEDGPDDNPLNIASWSNGKRSFRGYGSTAAAVDATVRLLGTDTYSFVLRTARAPQATIRDELWAIIVSPWEEDNYAHRGKVGAKLIATYTSLYPKRPSVREPSQAFLDDIARGVVRGEVDPSDIPGGTVSTGSGLPGLPDPGEWIDKLIRFLGDRAAVAFLYVVLTALAVALIVTGLLRATGTQPASVRSSVGARLRPAPDDIPF